VRSGANPKGLYMTERMTNTIFEKGVNEIAFI
jgi:hypothetical protein